MTIPVPVLEKWSAEVAKEVLREKQLADSEDVTAAEIKQIVSMQGNESSRQLRATMIAEGKTPSTELDTPQLDSKMSQLGDIRLARKIQRDKMAEIRRREGARLCLELKPAFDASAKKFADALVVAHSAALEMNSLESQLKAQSIGFYPIVCNINTETVIGWPTDRTSNFARLLHECVQMKHLKSMPKEIA